MRLKPNREKPRERGSKAGGVGRQPGVNAGPITAGAASPVNGAASTAWSITHPRSVSLHKSPLKVVPGVCPNLLAEAELYRYSDGAPDKRAEAPVDDNNHALAALRYLVMKLAEGLGIRTQPRETPAEAARKKEEGEHQRQREWLSVGNEVLWADFGR